MTHNMIFAGVNYPALIANVPVMNNAGLSRRQRRICQR
jgi:hypothetical protein